MPPRFRPLLLACFGCFWLALAGPSPAAPTSDTIHLALAPRATEGQILEENAFGTFGGGGLRLKAERRGQRIDLAVSNDYGGPVTLAMTFRLHNVGPDPGVKTVVIDGGATIAVATFWVTNPAQKFQYSYQYSWTYGRRDAQAAAYVYGLPFQPGRAYPVIQGFNGAFSHRGTCAIDWAMPDGTDVLATREGTVLAYHDRATDGGLTPEFRTPERGNWIMIQHPDDTIGCYYHLQFRGVLVEAGQSVQRGDLIGRSGNTGYSGTPHLHFEVRSPRDGFQYRTFAVRFQTGGAAEGEFLQENERYDNKTIP